MKRKLACADFTFPLLTHDQSLDVIAMLDFDGVDIGLFEGRSHLQPSNQFPSLRNSARLLKRKAQDRGLEVADIYLQTAPEFRSLAANHPEASRRRKAREMFERTLEYASEAGAKHVSALPGTYFEQESRAQSWRRCCDELAWRCERAHDAGLEFSVEAHVGSIVPTPRAAARLVESVPSLTLALDYAHFTRSGFADAQIEPLVRYAGHFHARGSRRGRVQASLKQNTIDFRRVLLAMDEARYRGYITLEYVWIDWEHANEVDNLSETVLLRDLIRGG